MRDAVILSAVRTPTGRFLGSLKGFTAPELGSIVVREAVRRVGGRVTVGCYGDVTLGNIRAKAETGVDVISVNRLTQSPPMVQIGLDEAVA